MINIDASVKLALRYKEERINQIIGRSVDYEEVYCKVYKNTRHKLNMMVFQIHHPLIQQVRNRLRRYQPRKKKK